MSLTDFISENFRALLVLAGGYGLAVQQGYTSAPTLPEWSGLLGAAGIILLLAGYVAGGKIDSLLPEEEGIYLVCLESQDTLGGEVWNLTEDEFEDLTVVEGTLMQWQVPGQVYECYHYNPDTNTAVAGWRESPAASQFAGGTDVEKAIEFIKEVRNEFEPSHQKFVRLQRQLRAVARRLDRRRLEDQNAVLDPHLTPSFDDGEAATVSSIIDEVVDDDLRDDRDDDPDDIEDDQAEDEFVSLDVLDDTEPEVLAND